MSISSKLKSVKLEWWIILGLFLIGGYLYARNLTLKSKYIKLEQQVLLDSIEEDNVAIDSLYKIIRLQQIELSNLEDEFEHTNGRYLYYKLEVYNLTNSLEEIESTEDLTVSEKMVLLKELIRRHKI